MRSNDDCVMTTSCLSSSWTTAIPVGSISKLVQLMVFHSAMGFDPYRMVTHPVIFGMGNTITNVPASQYLRSSAVKLEIEYPSSIRTSYLDPQLVLET